MPKKIYDYPEGERLEFVVLVNSPCTPSDILKVVNIPARPDTLKTVKKKLDALCKQGKIRKKKVARGNIYWHASIDDYKKDVLAKKFRKITRT